MRYDLLLTNGRVLDPSQGLKANLDVAIVGGKIAALGSQLDRSKAVEVRDIIDKYVCPGLIDLHGHWYNGSAFGVDPRVCLNTGVTTAVDAGTTGFINFPEFRRTCIDRLDLRTLAFINISGIGIPSTLAGELEDLRYVRAEETAATVAAHRDVAVGIKIRQGSAPGGHNGIEALERALTAAREAGVPLMVHISPGAEIAEILRRLRPGDIVTHCYQ